MKNLLPIVQNPNFPKPEYNSLGFVNERYMPNPWWWCCCPPKAYRTRKCRDDSYGPFTAEWPGDWGGSGVFYWIDTVPPTTQTDCYYIDTSEEAPGSGTITPADVTALYDACEDCGDWMHRLFECNSCHEFAVDRLYVLDSAPGIPAGEDYLRHLGHCFWLYNKYGPSYLFYYNLENSPNTYDTLDTYPADNGYADCCDCMDWTITFAGLTMCVGCYNRVDSAVQVVNDFININGTHDIPCVGSNGTSQVWTSSWANWYYDGAYGTTCLDPNPTYYTGQILIQVVIDCTVANEQKITYVLARGGGGDFFDSGTINADFGDAIANTLGPCSFRDRCIGGTATVNRSAI